MCHAAHTHYGCVDLANNRWYIGTVTETDRTNRKSHFEKDSGTAQQHQPKHSKWLMASCRTIVQLSLFDIYMFVYGLCIWAMSVPCTRQPPPSLPCEHRKFIYPEKEGTTKKTNWKPGKFVFYSCAHSKYSRRTNNLRFVRCRSHSMASRATCAYCEFISFICWCCRETFAWDRRGWLLVLRYTACECILNGKLRVARRHHPPTGLSVAKMKMTWNTSCWKLIWFSPFEFITWQRVNNI